MISPVAEQRMNWRRHDLVYDPHRQRLGTIVELRLVMGAPCAAVDFTTAYETVHLTTLDEWQAVNDERGKP